MHTICVFYIDGILNVSEVDDYFGRSVAISGDYCVIGARKHDLDVNDNPTGFNGSGEYSII